MLANIANEVGAVVSEPTAGFYYGKAIGLAGLIVAVLTLGYGMPLLLPAFHHEPFAIGLLYAIVALGLNIVNGQAGQFSIGHAAFAGIGGYTSAAVTTLLGPRLFATQDGGPPPGDTLPVMGFFIGSVLLGGCMAALCGLLIGMPTLRLRGDYLAIATLGFGEIVRVVIVNTQVLGGATGMHGIPKYSSFPVIACAFVLVALLCRNIATSLPGRSLIALREDEIAAESLGICTTRVKVTAMALSAGIAGVGGALIAHRLGTYHPNMCDWVHSVEFVLMVVLGGSGSITGTALAAIALGMLPGEMALLARYPTVQQITGNKMVIYSVLLVVMMLARRQGLVGRWELSLEWMASVGRRAALAVRGARRDLPT